MNNSFNRPRKSIYKGGSNKLTPSMRYCILLGTPKCKTIRDHIKDDPVLMYQLVFRYKRYNLEKHRIKLSVSSVKLLYKELELHHPALYADLKTSKGIDLNLRYMLMERFKDSRYSLDTIFESINPIVNGLSLRECIDMYYPWIYHIFIRPHNPQFYMDYEAYMYLVAKVHRDLPTFKGDQNKWFVSETQRFSLKQPPIQS